MTIARNGFDYNSTRWKALRRSALSNSRGRCVFCGTRGKYMYVDHIKSVRSRPDLAFDVRNLQVLCASHHNGLKAKLERREANGVMPVGLDGFPVSDFQFEAPAHELQVAGGVTIAV